MVSSRREGRAGPRIAAVLLLLLLATVAPPAEAQVPAPVLFLAYGEAPGGHLVPGLYLAAHGSPSLQRLRVGDTLDVKASPDGSRWAVLTTEHLLLVEQPGNEPGAAFPLQASSIAWRPEGGAVVAAGSIHGNHGVWEVRPDGTQLLLAHGDGLLAAHPLPGGDAMVVRTVGEGAETRRLFNDALIRPHAIDPGLVGSNGTGFVNRTPGGVRWEGLSAPWSVPIDPDPGHVPVRLAADVVFWEREDGRAWGFSRDGAATAVEERAAPVRIGAVAVDPGRGRAVVEVGEGNRWELLHLDLGSGQVVLRVPHGVDNLRAATWATPQQAPRIPPTPSPPVARDPRAPERVAFVSPGGDLPPGIWSARPDGTDLRLVHPAPGEPPRALGLGPPGFLAFLNSTGLFTVRWNGSGRAAPVVNGTVYSYAFSPSGGRLVWETDGMGSSTALILTEGGATRALGAGSAPSFHNEDWVRAVVGGQHPSLKTVMFDLRSGGGEVPLADAAVAPRAFSDTAPLFAYARDGHIYAAALDGARTTVRSDGSALLAFSGGATAFRTGLPGAHRLGVQVGAAATLLGPPAEALPAGTFVANATGLVVAFETAGVTEIRWFPSLSSSANLTWPNPPQGVRSLVAFRAPVERDPNAPLAGSRSAVPAMGRAGAVWIGSELFLFGGWNGTNASAGILRWDPRTDTFTTMGARLPRPLYGTAAVADASGAWIVGGTDGQQASDLILRYNPGTDTLQAVAPRLPTPRAHLGAAWTGSALLMAGGEGAAGPLGEILLFNPAANQLQVLPNAIAPRAGAASFFDGTALVLAGGRGPDGPLDTIVRVARDGASSSVAASRLPTARDGIAAAWDGGAAYIFGDPEGSGRPLRYDPGGDALLVMGARLPVHADMAAVWAKDRVVIVGGRNGTVWSPGVYFYEPARDSAVAVQPEPLPEANRTQPDNSTKPPDNTTNPPGNQTGPPGNTTNPPTNTTTNSTKNATGPPGATTVALADPPAGPVRGVVTFAPRGGGSFSLRATGSGGKELALGESKGDQGVTWDTTRVRNGRYTVTAYDANGTALESAEIVVQNPRSTAGELMVASATGVAVTVGLSALWGHLMNLLGTVKGWIIQAGEEEFKDQLRDKAAWGFALHQGSLWKAGLAMGGVATVLGVSSAYAEANHPSFEWSEFISMLPFVAGTVGVFYSASLLFDHFYARHIGRESEFRIWAPGTAALTASTALFATPFGVPGFVEGSETEDRRLEGRRGLASYLVLLALVLPFSAAYLWRLDVYETGISAVLMLAVNAAVPVRRLPGALVWRWNKAVWAAVTALAFALFAMSQMALASPQVFAVAGALGLVGIGGVFLSHRLLPEGYLAQRRAAATERAAERAEAQDALQDVARAAAAGEGPEAPQTESAQPPPESGPPR